MGENGGNTSSKDSRKLTGDLREVIQTAAFYSML